MCRMRCAAVALGWASHVALARCRPGRAFLRAPLGSAHSTQVRPVMSVAQP